MPKSKNRRPNRQPQQTQSPLPAPSLPQANSRSLLQTLGHTWTAIVSIGAIGGFLSLVEHSWDFSWCIRSQKLRDLASPLILLCCHLR